MTRSPSGLSLLNSASVGGGGGAGGAAGAGRPSVTTSSRQDVSESESVMLLKISLRSLFEVSQDTRPEVGLGGLRECGRVGRDEKGGRKGGGGRRADGVIVLGGLLVLMPSLPSFSPSILWPPSPFSLLSHLPPTQVRNSSVRTLFLAICSNGRKFTPATWKEVLWDLVLPLLSHAQVMGREERGRRGGGRREVQRREVREVGREGKNCRD